MNLTEKLASLKSEKAQKEQEKEAAHQRIIELNALIRATERLIKDAEEVFGKEEKTNEKSFVGDNGPTMGMGY